MKKLLILTLAAGLAACSSNKPGPLSLQEFRTLTPEKAMHAYGRPDTSYTEGSYTVMLYWEKTPDSTIGTPTIEHTSNGLPFFLVPHPVGSNPEYRQLAFNGERMYKGSASKGDLRAQEEELDSLRRVRGHR
jgi:hypothetical protein